MTEDAAAEANEKASQIREKMKNIRLPEPEFMQFVAGLVQQTFFHLGVLPDPLTGKAEASLPHAKYSIDLLQILQDKTRNNLTADEQAYLEKALYDLRMAYVEALKQSR